MCNCKKTLPDRTVRSAQSAVPPQDNRSRRKQSAARKWSVSTPALAAPVVPIEIEGETMADKCRTFAYMLGLEQPVSETVLVAAVELPAYARSLLQAANKPEHLNDLLNNPPYSQPSKANTYTATKLLTKASSAIMKWALSGFPTVPRDILQKREEACLACPNLTAPAHRLQQLSASATVRTEIGMRTGNKTCSACGCVITNKIRLATETCPVEDTAQAGMNLWGEPIRSA